MKNFRLYNRIITDIEKGAFYYEIINGEKDSNNEFIVYKTRIEIEDISENSNWEEIKSKFNQNILEHVILNGEKYRIYDEVNGGLTNEF